MVTQAHLVFSYNLANLPSKVDGVGNNAGLTYSYGYLSDGTKTSADCGSGSGSTAQGLRYRGSFVYEILGGEVERLQSSGNRHRFGGKEEQRIGSTDLKLLDFGARYYDAFACRWTSLDPLAWKYPAITPYSYCAGNPVNLVDPEGKDIYSFDKRSGTFTIVENNDNEFDSIVKLNKKGKIQYTIIDKVEKGILYDGVNFKENDQIYDLTKEGAPSLEGIEHFVIDLGETVYREIGGIYFSKDLDGSISHIVIGRYSKNDSHNTRNYGITTTGVMFYPEFKEGYWSHILGFFHTHPNDINFTFEQRKSPSITDREFKRRQLKNYPHLSFYILTQPSYGKEYKFSF